MGDALLIKIVRVVGSSDEAPVTWKYEGVARRAVWQGMWWLCALIDGSGTVGLITVSVLVYVVMNKFTSEWRK